MGTLPARVREARAVLGGVSASGGTTVSIGGCSTRASALRRRRLVRRLSGWRGRFHAISGRRSETLRQLSGKLIAAQEEERRRIARDLHDSVGQRMALVSIRLHDLRQRVSGRTTSRPSWIICGKTARLVAREVHSLSHRLHSAKLDALGLVGAVASECREMSESGVLVQFSDDAVPPVSSDVGLCVFRIVQAALGQRRQTQPGVVGAGDADGRSARPGGQGSGRRRGIRRRPARRRSRTGQHSRTRSLDRRRAQGALGARPGHGHRSPGARQECGCVVKLGVQSVVVSFR